MSDFPKFGYNLLLDYLYIALDIIISLTHKSSYLTKNIIKVIIIVVYYLLFQIGTGGCRANHEIR